MHTDRLPLDTSDQRGSRPVPPRRSPTTVGGGLRPLLWIVLAAAAVLAGSGGYLSLIRGLEWLRGVSATTPTTLWVFLVHVALGAAVAIPFVIFGIAHWRVAHHRPNRVAARRGLWLFAAGLVVVLTGFALVQLEGLPQLRAGSPARLVTLLLHQLVPLAAIALYIAHRRVGPRLAWRGGVAWAAAAAAVAVMAVAVDPLRMSNTAMIATGMIGDATNKTAATVIPVGDEAGRQDAFTPSSTRTGDGRTVSAGTLMMDSYCLRCHQDAYKSWFHSAHHYSSFNNPPYLASVRETRAVAVSRDGNTQAVKWCAGCHDPVPLLSGALDDPHYDDVNHPTAHAGITCTVCHAISQVHTLAGNGGYTLEEPHHYPFATSESEVLQWVNAQLVRSKPDFHKRSFLKPVHRSAEFCSTCHKVSIPPEVNHYKDFLRGQNHYDSFALSGASGHGARSFYYPEHARETCAACHMPTQPSADPAARDFAKNGTRSVHDHLFPGANTGLPTILAAAAEAGRGRETGVVDGPESAAAFHAAATRHADFLRGTKTDGSDRKLRIDIFGLKEEGRTDGRLVAPLRPELPALEPGRKYLVEVVVRTLALGHHFTQGTVDSNEVWIEFTATAGDAPIAASGRMAGPGDSGSLDPWAHRLNVLVLDRNGNRVDRRNPQDIFTPLYDHQIPPGAAQVVHYLLDVPADATGPVTLAARVRYRKFDQNYMEYVQRSLADGRKAAPTGEDAVAGTTDSTPPVLPVVDLCADSVTLPMAGGDSAAALAGQASPVKPAWQRWNDYGIGCLLEGGANAKRGELRQAEEAFRVVAEGKESAGHGWINLARVLIAEGRLTEAVDVVNAARTATPPPPWWLIDWFTGLIAVENAAGPEDLDRGIGAFERILDPDNQPVSRGFDFSRDYVVRNRLADTIFRRAVIEEEPARERTLRRAVVEYRQTLALEPEDLDAHYGLAQCFARLAGDTSSPVVERVEAIGREPFDPERPRLPELKALLAEHASTADAPEPGRRKQAWAALAAIHREIHALLRPDEQAIATAVSKYRAAHPEANLAAEPVPIYPLSRPSGEPGVTAP
jgi:hypothetical protein